MSTPALSLTFGRVLRIAIIAADPVRRAELRKLLVAAGHQIVTMMSEAQVVLSEGDAAQTDAVVVTLGAEDSNQAGSLPRDASAEQIDAALRAAAAGLMVRPARERVGGFDAMRERSVHALLTPREVEILAAIGTGLSNKAIARRFDISLHTVKFHVESLFKKLGARTRAEAVAKGLERRRNETVEL
jgi:DNA-binding NarL/FixJ family response regulator